MSGGRFLVLTLLAGLIGVGGGLFLYRYWEPDQELPSLPNLLRQPFETRAPVAEFSLPDLEGVAQSSRQWAGKVLVLNFWASWCGPCREEMPLLMRMQQELGPRGLQFVGIAIDDPVAARTFAQRLRINYPILVGAEDAIALSQQLGNRLQGLPFTAILDRSGRLAYVQVGELKREVLEQQLGPLF